MEFRDLFYSTARRGEAGDKDELQRALTSAFELLLPEGGFRVSLADDKQVEVSDSRDPSRRVYSAFGGMNGYQTFELLVSPELMESVEPVALREFLSRLSRLLDLDVGRTHVDPDSHALWPDEWGGKVNGVGWYQYFGARVAPRLEASTVASASLFIVERYEDGSLALTLRSGPLEDPSWEATDAVAGALGITLRDSDEA